MERAIGETPITDLPGGEMVVTGLADLAAGRESIEAAAVAAASERLSAVGLEAAPLDGGRPAAHVLYERVAVVRPADAHSHYNAILRRVASFARAAEHARGR